MRRGGAPLLRHNERHVLLSDDQDSLFDEVHERALQEARIKHDIYSREQKISSQQEVIAQNRYKIMALAAVLVLLLLALGMTYFFYKKKVRLYRAIVLQNHQSLPARTDADGAD